MRYIEENLKEFEICGILKWHEKGYTGKGIKIAEIENANPSLPFFDGKLHDPFGECANAILNGHGQKVFDVMHQVAPDAELYSLPGGMISNNNNVSGDFVEKTLPYAIENNIHIINASLDGWNHLVLNEKILEAQKHGVVFTTSAGNKGQKGLSGFAKSNVWIAIGAVGWNDRRGKIFLKYYSSRGPALDVVCFSGLYIHDAKNSDRVCQVEGTSFSAPMLAGMIALVQQFFLEKIGKILHQNEMEQFIYDHVIDLGEQGFDQEYGYGLFILPEPESIDVNKYLIYQKECDNMKIIMQIGNKTAYVDNKPVELDVAPKIENNRTLIPLRFVAENLGCKVEWDQNTKTITIIK